MHQPMNRAQLAANRANAQKSTGPKTKLGKACSSKNALKHGLLAKDVVINAAGLTEHQAQFDALLADLCKELKPKNLIEETLVERIATCYWRLRRAQNYESGVIRTAAEVPNPNRETLEKTHAKLNEAVNLLSLHQRLWELLNTPSEQRTAEESQELQKHLDGFAELNLLHVLNVNKMPVDELARMELPNILQQLESKADKLRDELQSLEDQDALYRKNHPLLSSLPDRDSLWKVVRYETMLDRQIHRALAELRRLRKVPNGITEKKRVDAKRSQLQPCLKNAEPTNMISNMGDR